MQILVERLFQLLVQLYKGVRVELWRELYLPDYTSTGPIQVSTMNLKKMYVTDVYLV